MSQKLAMRVLESALDASLKFTATVMALHADDHGYRCFPSVPRLAWLMGVQVRAVQNKLTKLRALGVLIPQTRLNRGRGRTVAYQLQLDLQSLNRPSWQEEYKRSVESLALPLLGRVHVDTKRVHATAERVHADTEKGAPACTRSLIDLSEDHSGDQIACAREPEQPQKPTAQRRGFSSDPNRRWEVAGERAAAQQRYRR